MESRTIHKHQEILEQFKLHQIEIEYSRFLSNKSECTIVIENKQNFIQWSESLENALEAIEHTSMALEKNVDQDEDHENLLGKLDTALDELIHLQMEVTASCAHITGLMEGRYLIDHAVGYYLDQISLHIHEYRYQLNQLVFNCNEDKTEKPLPLAIGFQQEVEIKAFTRWLSQYEDPVLPA